MLAEVRTGPVISTDAAVNPARSDRTGAIVTVDGHARFQEAAIRNALFSAGMTLTSISNATFSTGTLTATATPIIGLWNPLGSGKNLVVLQVRVQIVNTALQVTGAGALVWATSTAQGAISTGITPLNRFSLTNTGSVAKAYAGTALTGLVGSLVVQESGAFGGVISNVSTLQTAAGLIPSMPAYLENIDGGFVIPPGGVIALLCTTNPPVAISAASSILWEEIAQ